jgi:alkyl hydroperoxide reductase subunit AhpC
MKILALSCNDVESHRNWIVDIEKVSGCRVDFPIVADPDRAIANAYGMIDRQDATNIDAKGLPMTVRSVFFIDEKNIVRLIMVCSLFNKTDVSRGCWPKL